MNDRQRRTMLQMQRIRPLIRRKNHYVILGVSRDAPQRDITTAYRELARVIAPDMNPGIDTTEIFQLVNEAYEVLSDQSKRREYDSGGREEYSYEDEDGSDESFASENLSALLSGGVKPSEHYRQLFEGVQQRTAGYWDHPLQPLDHWLMKMTQVIASKIDEHFPRGSERLTSSVSTRFSCSLCSAVLCAQNDPRRSEIEIAHMKAVHNAYFARIASIRTALNDPISIEQALYIEHSPFPLPLKKGFTILDDGTAPPQLLRRLAEAFRAHNDPSFCATNWLGRTEWQQFLSFLDDASLEKVCSISFRDIKQNLRQAASHESLPMGCRDVIPAAEVQSLNLHIDFLNTNYILVSSWCFFTHFSKGATLPFTPNHRASTRS